MAERWTDSDMTKFLELYKEKELLWNPKLDSYRDNSARIAALDDIINNLQKPNLTQNDLKIKIKNIRTIYCRELTKLLKSKIIGVGTNDIYKPGLRWFEQADEYLRTVTEAKHNKSYLMLRNKIQVENMKTSNLKMKSTKTPIISTIEKEISKLDGIAKGCVDNEFETFGKHVANQMRKIPLERALILQNDIQGLLTRERLRCLSYSKVLSTSSTSVSTTRTLLCSNSTRHYSSDTSSTDQPTVCVNTIEETENSCKADILAQAWSNVNMCDFNN
uniref:MADF domain-containing protein n=1 Tax=Sipha flava TaxID=143950 RepID=A0A2S2QPU3_9HEMI